MNHSARLALLSLASLLLPVSSMAQEDESQPFGNRDIENIDLSNYYSPPAVYIESITVEKEEGRMLQGTVNIVNMADAIVGDIHFRLELLGGLGDGGSPEDVVERGDIVAVPALEHEEKYSVPFTYERPLLAAGNYFLRAQIVTSQGREYGWGEYEFTVPPGEAPEVSLRSSGIKIDEFEGQTLEPLTGPNVDPLSEFTIEAIAENRSDAEVTVTPVLTVYNFDPARGQIDAKTYDPVTIEARKTHVFSLPVSALEDAGVSFASLKLVNGDGVQLSPLADFRWVVRGAHAQVMSLRLANMATASGETVFAFVDFVGAPDAETPVSARLDIVLSDDEGEIAAVHVPPMDLTDAIELGRADLHLTRDMQGDPVLTSTLTSPEGVVYHTYEISFGEGASKSASTGVSVVALASLAIFVIGAGVVAYRRFYL